MVNLSEKETREKYIDPILEEVGWKEEYIKREVNSVSSDFKKNKHDFKKGFGKEEGRFIDYILVYEDQSPLAIIEAKRFSLDPEKGTIQATTYQKDIESKKGIAIPIFLTNGKKWYIKEKGYPMREISGPFSQQSLKKKLDNALRKKDISQIEINPNIVDRSRGIQIVKQILDHFNSGKRNALINMATGTGKTRVSMAIIDSLVNKAKSVTNVLFVVDRIALGNNAFYKGFQKFFRDTPQGLLNLEKKQNDFVHEKEFDRSKRFYVSTVQTLMAKRKQGGHAFQDFDPGFFDLIIYDEAHRSYYDKQNLVMNYFDSLKIGLTATPSKNEDRNTYDLFECERGKPTVEYTYDEAIKDGVLVPYDAQIIETKVTKFGIKGADLSPELKTMLIKQDADPDSFEMPGARLFKNFIDKKTNELIVTEFMNRCYRDEAGRPCKTIFFCVNVKHAQALKKVFDELYPKFSSEDVDVIVSSYDRYMDAVDRFLKDSSPRIALSVGVLDTGIDIPEAMNLVFVTPVFSHIRFWQMLGRGTRNKSAVIGNSPDHVKWLPVYDGVHDKKDFRILDFKFGEFSNVKEHQLEKTDNKLSSEDIREKIFDKQLEVLKKKLDDKEKKIVEEHIIDRIKKIDQKSFIVRDKVPMIKKVVSREYDLTSHIKEIKSEIKPLLKFSEFGDGRIQTFISHCSDLFRYVKESDIDAISKEQKFVSERIINVWETNLEAVRKKEDGIKKILQDKFWNELTFEDIDFLIREIAPLMVYYEKQKKRIIKVDEKDFILDVEEFKMEIKENEEFEKFKNNPLIKKIGASGVTWKELQQISEKLSELNPSWDMETIQKRQDFILFLRNILDLKDLPDPEEVVRQEFEKLIIQKNKDYNAQQIAFLRLLASFFALNKHLERKDFALYPLSEERPLDKFSQRQLDDIIEKVAEIRLK